MAEHLTDAKFEIEEGPPGATKVICQGIGFKALSQPLNEAIANDPP